MEKKVFENGSIIQTIKVNNGSVVRGQRAKLIDNGDRGYHDYLMSLVEKRLEEDMFQACGLPLEYMNTSTTSNISVELLEKQLQEMISKLPKPIEIVLSKSLPHDGKIYNLFDTFYANPKTMKAIADKEPFILNYVKNKELLYLEDEENYGE